MYDIVVSRNANFNNQNMVCMYVVVTGDNSLYVSK